MSDRKRKIKPYIVLPVVLLIYAVIMAYMGRENYFDPEQRTTYLASIGAEVVILVGLFFFLRKRYRLRQRRKDDTDALKK